jgi:hypothetical protein
MQARIRIGAGGPLLTHEDIKFSDEAGGSGTLSFTALYADLSASGALDPSKVLFVELETSPGVWTAVLPYVLRPPFKRKRVGVGTVACLAVSVPEGWGAWTVFYPEYATNQMVPEAGTERGLGWMNTAYAWQSDPREPWDKCYEASRSERPTEPEWPTGSGAKWISASGATAFSERKLFRSEMTITGTGPQMIRCYFSSDESATLWIAAEKVLETSNTEFGRKYTEIVDVHLFPGTYAVGIDTKTHFTKGGDGVDPVILACAKVDDDGEPTSWVKVTDDTWGACRRDDITGPNSNPPGPTPGAIILDIIGEAVTRGTCGWANVTYDFDGVTDSYGAPWAVSTERLVRYGFDDYAQFFNALGETEADIWMTPDMVLHAAPKQGQIRGYTWTENQILSMSDVIVEDLGTAIMGLTTDGWVSGVMGGWRRESGLEIGQALSTDLGQRVIASALSQVGRWDASFTYAPGQIPFFDFNVGDWVQITYRDLTLQVRILSISASAGDGGLLWSMEVTNEPTS